MSHYLTAFAAFVAGCLLSYVLGVSYERSRRR